MLPEISRRCLACGASVRAGGRFCHQCGAKLGDAPGEAAEADAGAKEAGAATDAPADAEFGLMETWREWEKGVSGRIGERAASEPKAPGDGATRATGPGATNDDAVAKDDAIANASAPETPSGMFRRPQTPARAARTPEEVKAAPPEIEKREPVAPASAPSSPTVNPSATTPPVNTVAAADVAESSSAVGAAVAASKGRRAAAVRESLRPRVERVRDASMGVIEEASEDTGLRFVLISFVLFLLFLFLLFLNYVIN